MSIVFLLRAWLFLRPAAASVFIAIYTNLSRTAQLVSRWLRARGQSPIRQQ